MADDFPGTGMADHQFLNSCICLKNRRLKNKLYLVRADDIREAGTDRSNYASLEAYCILFLFLTRWAVLFGWEWPSG